MNTRTTKTRRLVESAILLAIATVLSELALVKLPYGGSVTLASMLPVLLIAYRHGTPWGLACGLCYGVLQQLLGLSTLSYFTTWQSIVAIVLLDYLIAFAVIGLGGIFRHRVVRQPAALSLGALLVCILRYICHVISGATVWAGLSIPTEAALLYSLAYNATYMLPETIVTVLLAVYLGSVLDFTGSTLRRRVPQGRTAPQNQGFLTALAGFSVLGATVFDVAMIAARLQNGETGEFDWAGLAGAPFTSLWLPVIIVSGAALVLAAMLFLVGRRIQKKSV
ncbi:MAG: energy-coupled thiamine transporter ThiT [Clostridia bacterium]|nr:energy-coupled thiamine transporter ThiT [Clostridia bacterium]